MLQFLIIITVISFLMMCTILCLVLINQKLIESVAAYNIFMVSMVTEVFSSGTLIVYGIWHICSCIL